MGIAQVGTAVVLAYFTIKLYKATDRYANSADSQNEIMNEQNGKLESQNTIMSSQNQLMIANMDHDILVMKYNRMLDEMNNLVAPLYARRNDPQIFQAHKYEKKIELYKRAFDIHRDDVNKEFHDFWENIFKNLYLNQSNKLQKSIDMYFPSINKFVSHYDDSPDPVELEMDLDDFKNTRKILKDNIETRYEELRTLISDIENELRISESSKQPSTPDPEDV